MLCINKHQRTPQDDANTFLDFAADGKTASLQDVQVTNLYTTLHLYKIVIKVGLAIQTVREVQQVPDLYHLLKKLTTIITILTCA